MLEEQKKKKLDYTQRYKKRISKETYQVEYSLQGASAAGYTHQFVGVFQL